METLITRQLARAMAEAPRSSRYEVILATEVDWIAKICTRPVRFMALWPYNCFTPRVVIEELDVMVVIPV